METIYCANCGHKNNISTDTCEKCCEILHIFTNANKEINSINELFTDMHLFQLNNKILSLDAYETIIQSIIESGKNRLTYKEYRTPLEQIKALAEAYSILIFKNDRKNYGEYAFNVICVDECFDEAIQIATILHELTHHLFNTILCSIVMYVWNVKKTPMLDAFIQTMTTIPEVLLISEYCASSTEKIYLPEEYVSYSSFNSICADLKYDKTKIMKCFIIGKGIHKSICQIFDAIMDNQLKDDIKNEFKKYDTTPIGKPICISDNQPTNNILRNVYIMNLINNSYNLINNKEIYPLLEKNKKYYEKSQIKGAYY